MAETVRETIQQLFEAMQRTLDELLAAGDAELAESSSHVCAQDRDLWALVTNDIDHEVIHSGQVLEARYESRLTRSPMERLVATWLEERARFIGSLVGMSDEAFNSPTAEGSWTYREVAEHVVGVERHSMKTMRSDRAARQSP